MSPSQFPFPSRPNLPPHAHKHRTGRRSAKITSLFASCFTSHYVRHWPAFFPATPLAAAPMFDARAVCYPDEPTLRDYLSWRQADTHINNQVRTGGRSCSRLR